VAHTVVFPPLRKDRSKFGGAAAAPVAPVPVSRVFEFKLRMSAGGNVRSTRSSPILQGPFLIQHISGTISATDADGDWGVELGTSPVDISETDVLMTVAKPWDALITAFGQTNVAGQSPQPVVPLGFPSNSYNSQPMRLYVPRLSVRLVVSLQTQSQLGNPVFIGIVTLLDGVPPEAVSVIL